MRKIYVAAHVYMILGLISGLFYREFTKLNDFTGDSQLSVVHTHILALGMLFFLIVLALEKLFTLTAGKLFTAFFWVYNAGLALTVGLMIVRGSMTVLGHEPGAALDGISGLGHITITLGLIFFFVNLGKCLPAKEEASLSEVHDVRR
ncbi:MULTISPECIES: DUF2871 domain-containing protein [Kribbella]|jgi:hypothetical protein|uniref:Uncharacterized protein DUF2871 n=1 Tax=Kribbella pratensis TaxID=2512112 RepID=A0ABY2FF18_9ACTN|nr:MULTISPECIES: DUF2871 domain-containing protein [Kribbella]TDW89833.1 uncharacterized protein DUF2871 [Kribbella pratensis]TDX08895.1 uncharacterized protein DUF2871 [Kribbella sp. VKM Ac-2566]